MRKAALWLVLAVLVAGAIPAGPARAGITLTYSNFFPPSHAQSKLAEAWCREIEKRTGGKVTIQYFPGQTLTKARQVYDGVVNGISDIGQALFAYTRGRFPVMEVLDLPLGYPSGRVATAVVNRVYRELRPKELDGVKVLYLHAHGPGLVHCKVRPIRTLEDMRGLKFRATGFAAKVVSALGGTPVAMPMPETYQALAKGVVDGALYPIEANKGWRLAEVTKYVTENYSMAYTSTFFIVMNKDRWNQLPPDVQRVFEDVSAEWVEKTGLAWDEADREGRDYFLQKGGEIVALSPEESARWKKAVAPILDEYVKNAENKGLDGRRALEVTKKALAEYTEKYGSR